ncbi:MAG: hypothetical protein U5L06_04690 [Rhodovibrio sp.]|nr:hypothetical protein [Rhodovibrio sp.]
MPTTYGDPAQLVQSWTWSVAGQLHLRRTKIAERVAQRLIAQTPALTRKAGDQTRFYVERDVGLLLEHLSQAIALTDPILFHDHIAWAKSMLTARGLKGADLKRTLELIAEALDEDLSPAVYSSAITLIEDAIQRLRHPDRGARRTAKPAGPARRNRPRLHRARWSPATAKARASWCATRPPPAPRWPTCCCT